MMNNIALIMCTWKRIHKLKLTLDSLLKQNYKDFSLYIWNNNIDIKNQIIEICDNYKAFIDINIIHSDFNVGGFGRFEYAKLISDKHDIVVFIDDDQHFNENMLSTFKSEYSEKALKSRWAWRFNGDNYSNRTKIDEGGKLVHYCGTGGMVLPSYVFKNDELFNIPIQFKFVEDLWLSYVCDSIIGLDLISIKDSGFINQIDDGLDQFYNLMPLKNNFMVYLLTEKKWILKK